MVTTDHIGQSLPNEKFSHLVCLRKKKSSLVQLTADCQTTIIISCARDNEFQITAIKIVEIAVFF